MNTDNPKPIYKSISFGNALGVYETALKLRSRRAAVLANNLANVDTPNYKARDLDFQSLLKQQTQTSSGAAYAGSAQATSSHNGRLNLAQTHSKHRTKSTLYDDDETLLYRTPNQPSIDGNTVEETVEHAQYSKNSLEFLTSFQFLDSAFRGLKSAIRGE